MFEELLNKFNSFEEHHQVLFAIIVIIGVVIFSWGLERLLGEYVFKQKSFSTYVAALLLGLSILWLTKYIILRVI